MLDTEFQVDSCFSPVLLLLSSFFLCFLVIVCLPLFLMKRQHAFYSCMYDVIFFWLLSDCHSILDFQLSDRGVSACTFLSMYVPCDLLSFLDLLYNVFHHFWMFSAIISPKFSSASLSSPPLWDFKCANVRLLVFSHKSLGLH